MRFLLAMLLIGSAHAGDIALSYQGRTDFYSGCDLSAHVYGEYYLMTRGFEYLTASCNSLNVGAANPYWSQPQGPYYWMCVGPCVQACNLRRFNERQGVFEIEADCM